MEVPQGRKEDEEERYAQANTLHVPIPKEDEEE